MGGQVVTRPQPAPAGINPDEVVGGTEAAVILGVTERTVQRWAEAGVLQVAYRTTGGHRRFRRRYLEAYADQHQQHAEQAQA